MSSPASEGQRPPPANERISDASAPRASVCQSPGRVYRGSDLVWDRSGSLWRLYLRSSNRALATVKPDVEYPNLCRAHVGPDVVTDILNLTRCKDAGVLLSLRMLNGEDAHRRTRRTRARP
jgi:hypothetical protein